MDQDRSVLALVELGTPTVSIFGKTWDLHVLKALGISPAANLKSDASRLARQLCETGVIESISGGAKPLPGFTAAPEMRQLKPRGILKSALPQVSRKKENHVAWPRNHYAPGAYGSFSCY